MIETTGLQKFSILEHFSNKLGGKENLSPVPSQKLIVKTLHTREALNYVNFTKLYLRVGHFATLISFIFASKLVITFASNFRILCQIYFDMFSRYVVIFKHKYQV